ncbi:MAG: hypothetical protein KBT05_03155 [Bacteroidales bacterium]|nr:hypothetical protein [Candidatus Cryptobacteroides caccocaballi]
MNLRVIKKDIEYFIGEFIDDCTLFMALNPEKNTDEIAAIIDESVDLYNDLKTRINHPDEPKKAYYNAIRNDLFAGLDQLCEKLSSAINK